MKIWQEAQWHCDRFRILLHQNISKNFIFGKKCHSAEKKLKGGGLWDFQHPFWRKTAKKTEGAPFGEKKSFRKKVSQCRIKLKGGPLVSPGMVCYAGKQEKPFWFSSLGQIVQFDTIKFRITFKNYFGQFVWIETSRDRPKSVPYPRLKNSKKTSKCQVFPFTVLENRKFLGKKFSKKLHTQNNGPSGAPGLATASLWRAKVSQCRKTERGTLWGFSTSILSQNMKKIEENKNFDFREKVSQCRKKCRGDHLGNFFRKKSLAVPKKMKGGILWSRPVWYVTRKNRKNLFGSVR